MINCLCYQIHVEISLCGTPSVNISFLLSYNHQFSYKTTPSFKDSLCCRERCSLWKRTILKVDVRRCKINLDEKWEFKIVLGKYIVQQSFKITTKYKRYNVLWVVIVSKTVHCFPPLPSMLVSRVCLGINVFQVNIEREGKENLVSVSTIITVIVRVDGTR